MGSEPEQMTSIFALLDCNNFYASCEKLFRPDLRHTPVVVLSNNTTAALWLDKRKAKLSASESVRYCQPTNGPKRKIDRFIGDELNARVEAEYRLIH